ncbi:hypothetical protein IWW51_001115 [Coemansia sp. RSA 2702]|nr:hypothetical protein IWW51_001115 [Coemansia sp. RSA 2702]KAJ2366590.1 hypothetical protein H4S01_002623 [Coemansia sp. RSA 2610]
MSKGAQFTTFGFTTLATPTRYEVASFVWFYAYHTLDWWFRQIGRIASLTQRNVYPTLGLLAVTATLFSPVFGSNTFKIENQTSDTMAAVPAGVEWGDMVIVSSVIIGAATFLFRRYIFGAKPAHEQTIAQRAAAQTGALPAGGARRPYDPERDMVVKMRNAGKNVVILYGSQTGTAEDFATRLGKDIHSAAVRPLVLDPEQYDWQCLASLGSDELVIFVLATAGEGEATDNMEAWFAALASDAETPEDSEVPEFRQPEDRELDEDTPLQEISYAMFGLGNNTYERFNHHARVVDGRLQALGATRVGERGEGDDDADIEEDFARWKEATLPLIRQHLGSTTPLESGDESPPEPTWKIAEAAAAQRVWTKGEFFEGAVATHDSRHPFAAPVTAAVDLTPTADRHVLHVEVDLAGSGMRHESGDHIGVYPTNADEEVDLLLSALGLLDRADVPIAVRATDPFAPQQSLFPVETTTYRAAFRHYLEITAPVPRAQIASLVLPFARSEAARNYLRPLAVDKDAHAATVAAGCMTPARLINGVHAAERQAGTPDEELFVLPVEAAFELCPRLQARLYSISSSGKVHPERPTITAVVLQYDAKTEQAQQAKLGACRCGVATNYLLGVLRYLRGDRAVDLESAAAGHALRTGCLVSDSTELPGGDASSAALVSDGKNHVLQSFTLQPAPDSSLDARALTMPVFIRKSTFRLPADSATPIIMIGPGTGLAPMRAFIQERAQAARAHPDQPMGTTLLFFGARTEAHDFMYRDELDELFADIRRAAPESQVVTAFSRDQAQKVYVQHRLAEHAELVYRTLLCGQSRLGGAPKAHVYVCGDAKCMAKDVSRALALLIAEREGVSEETAAKWVSDMRKLSRYQEDVWS